jgi:hypothetical protein
MQYFKYTKKLFLESMLRYGNVRVGTLHGYRAIDKAVIRDKKEGVGTGKLHIPYRKLEPGEDLSFQGHKLIGGGGGNEVKNFTATFSNIQISDKYMYCLSTKASKNIMLRTENDACVEILDIGKFIYCLRVGLASRGKVNFYSPVLADVCRYTDNREALVTYPDDLLRIAFLKGFTDEYQKEFRILMNPDLPIIHPVNLDIPEIKQFLSLISFD